MNIRFPLLLYPLMLLMAISAVVLVVIQLPSRTYTAPAAEIVSGPSPVAVSTPTSGFNARSEPEPLLQLSAIYALTEPMLPGIAVEAEDGWEQWLRKANVPKEVWPAFTVVARCESGFTPWKIGDGGSALGLMQIQPRYHLHHLATLGYPLDADLLLDPIINLKVTMLITGGGFDWWAWTCQPDGTLKSWG